MSFFKFIFLFLFLIKLNISAKANVERCKSLKGNDVRNFIIKPIKPWEIVDYLIRESMNKYED